LSNPWLKKNPFMSMWLSGAHRIAGSARAKVSAEAKRQVSHALSKAAEESTKQWFGTAVASPPKTRLKARTRKS
jgi:hypothetical protein